MNDSNIWDTALQQFDYYDTNCSRLIPVWNYLQCNATADFDLCRNLEPDEITYHYIIQGLKGMLERNSVEVPPMNQNFWTWVVYGQFMQYKIQSIGEKSCPIEMCRALGWEGSPDIAGVGVMLATYIIQAVLITVYLCGILVVNLNQRSNRSRMWPPFSRILCAVLDSTREFLSSSAIFSLALLIASVSSIAQPKFTPNPTIWIIQLVIPLYAVLAVVLLHLAAWDILHRSKGRASALLTIDVLVFVLAARSSTLFNGTDRLPGFKDYHPDQYKSPCLTYLPIRGMAIISWTIAGVLCLGVTTYLVDFLVSETRHRLGLLAPLSGMVRWAIVGVGLCLMWYLLSWFVKLTFDIRSRAGDNNKDSEWTFGQVLALSTWAPFIIEFAYNIWEGPKKANEALSNYPSKWALPDSSAIQPPEDDDERGNFVRLE